VDGSGIDPSFIDFHPMVMESSPLGRLDIQVRALLSTTWRSLLLGWTPPYIILVLQMKYQYKLCKPALQMVSLQHLYFIERNELLRDSVISRVHESI
jgi:hypothetical protein